MSLYTFKDKDILDSAIIKSKSSEPSESDDAEPVFITKTTQNHLDRETTKLVSSKGEVTVGEILWIDKMVSVGSGGSGVNGERNMGSIETNPRKGLNRNWHRIWQWDSGSPQYSVAYSNKQWNVTEATTGTLHASMKRIKTQKSGSTIDHSEITLEDCVLGDSNVVFLILILVQMETNRVDTKRKRRAFTDRLAHGLALAMRAVTA